MRIEKTSDEEYHQIEQEIKVITDQIAELRRKKNLLLRRFYYYKHRNDNVRDYKKGLAVQLFGKRQKDLNDEERKEYQRVRKRNSRIKNNTTK